MSNFVKYNFSSLLLIIIFFVMFFKGCFNNKIIEKETKIYTDTSYTHIQNNIISKPTPVKTVPFNPSTKNSGDTSYAIYYVKDTTVGELLKLVYFLQSKLLSTNIYKDTFKIKKDSLNVGFAVISDTTKENLLIGRGFSYNIKYPTITKTIETYIHKNKFLAGGGFIREFTDKTLYPEVGIGLKNKKDNILLIKYYNNFGSLNNKKEGASINFYKAF